MSKPRPKYVSNRDWSTGMQSFKAGDPVDGGRALELALRFGYVDSTAKSATKDPSTEPETADQQENPS